MVAHRRTTKQSDTTMESTNLTDLTHETKDEGDVIFCCFFFNL